jgi:hypothetical protein
MKTIKLEAARAARVDLPTHSWPVLLALRDDIREKLVFEADNLVFETELALLQAREPELIALGGSFQRNDRFVQIPVLLPELCELVAEAYIVRSVHQTPGEDAKDARPRKIADIFHHSTNPRNPEKGYLRKASCNTAFTDCYEFFTEKQ